MDLYVLGQALFTTVRKKHLTFLAASIAFYAFLSVIPVLVLILVLGTAVGEEAFATRVIALVEDVLSPTATATLQETLQNQTGSSIGILGIVGLLWSSLSVFRGLNIAFVEIYDGHKSISLLTQLRNGIITVLSIGCVVIAISLTSTLVQLSFISHWGIMFVLLFVMFYPIYYLLPPVSVSLRSVLPGVTLAVISWLLLQAGFRLYTTVSSKSALYGALGAAFLLLIWFYAASFFLLLGVALNSIIRQENESELVQ